MLLKAEFLAQTVACRLHAAHFAERDVGNALGRQPEAYECAQAHFLGRELAYAVKQVVEKRRIHLVEYLAELLGRVAALIVRNQGKHTAHCGAGLGVFGVQLQHGGFELIVELAYVFAVVHGGYAARHLG